MIVEHAPKSEAKSFGSKINKQFLTRSNYFFNCNSIFTQRLIFIDDANINICILCFHVIFKTIKRQNIVVNRVRLLHKFPFVVTRLETF